MNLRNVLFLCTGNSARSVLAEVYLNHVAGNRCRAHSAGSRPAGQVNPFALELLRERGMRTENLRSKSWDEYAKPGAPQMDFIFTVCANAAGETCPVWPGRPASAHWGVEDPAAVQGSDTDKRAAFAMALQQLSARIDAFLALPIEALDPAALKAQLVAIGQMTDTP